MEVTKIYVQYFSKKKKEILEIAQYYLSKECKIALWGAGKKGDSFLKAIDPDNRYIYCIFDKDKSKVGGNTSTGHKILDYQKEKVDVVFVANSVFELEVVQTMYKVNPQTKVVNVDNIILGDLGLEDILCQSKPCIKKNASNRICAVTVLYQPSDIVCDNIDTYLNEVDHLYLYDNSSEPGGGVYQKYNDDSRITFITPGQNMGLSRAFNEVARIASLEGYTWMITFDQDSKAEKGMISSMREFVDSDLCKDEVALVGPVVNDLNEENIVQSNYLSYYDKLVQSGAMHHLQKFELLGGYDEKLFIDEIDNEYCARCIIAGYKIVKLNNALLIHNQQDEDVEKRFVDGAMLYVNKFSSDRYYYKYRNALYCYEKYQTAYPLFALDCQNSIRKMKLQLENDAEFEVHQSAIEQAIDDFHSGRMGKRGVAFAGKE